MSIGKSIVGCEIIFRKNSGIGRDDFIEKVIFILLFIRNMVKIIFLVTML